jgi:co-chaperonin GroES (HSP10)
MAKAKSEFPYRAYGDTLIVKRLQLEKIGSIVLAKQDAKNERGNAARAEVLSVGPGMLLENGERCPMDCSVGDSILISALAGVTMGLEFAQELDPSLKDCEILMIRQHDILGVKK